MILVGHHFWNLSVVRVPLWTTLLFAQPISKERFHVHDYGDLDGSKCFWAAAEKVGKTFVCKSLKTFYGTMTKPQALGLPAASGAGEAW